MRIRPFTKRLAPYLTAYLLLVSVGIPLNRVYCACVGEQWITVVGGKHECHHDASSSSVHHHEAADVWSESQHQHHVAEADTCQSHKCGDVDPVLGTFDAEFLADGSLEYAPTPVYPPASTFDYSAVFPGSSPSSKATPIRGPTPPVSLSGRALLVAYQTFLI